MNIVLDEAFEEKEGGEKVAIGMIVRSFTIDGYREHC
jgi:small nuclear ribonucleoprotein (snRNP)-like protein